MLPPIQWASRNISIEEGDPASCLPSLIALTKSIQQVSGRVVVDPLSYFNRSDFETSDIESDDSSSPTIRDGNHGGDRESYSAGCQCQSCASHSDNVRRGKFVGFNGVWPRSNTPPDDKTFFLLCSFRTFAFVLKRRTWGM